MGRAYPEVCLQIIPGGATCLTLLVYCGLARFTRASSCQGSLSLQYISPLLKKACVRQVGLDKWFPP